MCVVTDTKKLGEAELGEAETRYRVRNLYLTVTSAPSWCSTGGGHAHKRLGIGEKETRPCYLYLGM